MSIAARRKPLPGPVGITGVPVLRARHTQLGGVGDCFPRSSRGQAEGKDGLGQDA